MGRVNPFRTPQSPRAWTRPPAASRGARLAAGGQELPSRDSLERLDTVRDAVEQLSLYEREGPPWSLRWGLYVGSDMYPTARALYFNRFKQLLFELERDDVATFFQGVRDLVADDD